MTRNKRQQKLTTSADLFGVIQKDSIEIKLGLGQQLLEPGQLSGLNRLK
jgi:hypothetical protein